MFFKGIKSIVEAKRLYRKLCLNHHPDRGGDLETMKQVNIQYSQFVSNCAQFYPENEGNETETDNYKYSKEEFDQELDRFKTVLDAIMHLDGISIEIIGDWVWVSGNTKPHKEVLKGLNFKWAPQKSAWNWHDYEWKPKWRKNHSLDEIRGIHGNKKVSQKRIHVLDD